MKEWLDTGGKRSVELLILESGKGSYLLKRESGQPYDVHTVIDDNGTARLCFLDFLHDQNFLGYYGTDLTPPTSFANAHERKLKKGEGFSGDFELIRLSAGDTAQWREWITMKDEPLQTGATNKEMR